MDDAKNSSYLENSDYLDCCDNSPNKHIKCTVKECEHHCKGENFCKLDKICVESHKDDPKDCGAVDCTSFSKDANY